ncbi:MAG: RHS repeat-associated core domain-containing protein, partial [Acidobacteriota bacterium]
TGHERDLGTLGGAGGVQIELDYMRARFCSPWTARFLSVDPARESVNLQRPQTWNRYSYTFNNPVTLVDPDGQVPILFKTAVKLAIKGGDIAATTAGIVEDAKTLASPGATAGERALAAASLLSEVVSPVSVRDAKLGIKATDAFGDAAGGADRVVDAASAVQGTVSRDAALLSRLSRAASVPDRNGLTAAGRSLQKHSSRPASAFDTKLTRASDLNQAGQAVVDEIVMSPGAIHRTNRLGGIDVVAPDGRGVRYNSDGSFRNFLEPRK